MVLGFGKLIARVDFRSLKKKVKNTKLSINAQDGLEEGKRNRDAKGSEYTGNGHIL